MNASTPVGRQRASRSLDRIQPAHARLAFLVLASLAVAVPSAAQIVPCSGIQDRGFKILLDDIFDAAGGAASPLMQSLIYRLSTNLEQLQVESGLPLKVVRCAKRRPSDPSEFRRPLVEQLNARQVVLEVWGTTAKATDQTGAEVHEATVGYLLVPVRFDEFTDGQPSGAFLLSRQAKSVTSVDELVRLVDQAGELAAYVAVSTGVKLLRSKEYRSGARAVVPIRGAADTSGRPDAKRARQDAHRLRPADGGGRRHSSQGGSGLYRRPEGVAHQHRGLPMTSTFLSLVGHNPAVSVRAGIVAILVACVPGLAVAGAQNIPCSRPFIFQGAAVNVVVLPYAPAPGLATAGGIGDRLSGLLQLEVLRAIAKFGSVGAVQMVGSAADCDPDLVVAKLLGRTPGAAATVRKGHGLVVVWGRFYSERGNVFVQTFCRLLRSGIDETFELVAGGRPFSAQISAQAFACAPRKVTVADMANFEEQFLRSTIVRTAPQESASGNRMPSGPQPYWISDTQGDWMKIAAQDGFQGWIRLSGARDSWSLARWLPELTYIEGIVGYLRFRIAAQQSIPVRAEWVANATRAFSEYEATLDPRRSRRPRPGRSRPRPPTGGRRSLSQCSCSCAGFSPPRNLRPLPTIA